MPSAAGACRRQPQQRPHAAASTTSASAAAAPAESPQKLTTASSSACGCSRCAQCPQASTHTSWALGSASMNLSAYSGLQGTGPQGQSRGHGLLGAKFGHKERDSGVQGREERVHASWGGSPGRAVPQTQLAVSRWQQKGCVRPAHSTSGPPPATAAPQDLIVPSPHDQGGQRHL